jgi:hypothetical protein
MIADLNLGLLPLFAVTFDLETLRNPWDLTNDGCSTRSFNNAEKQQLGHVSGELGKLVSK